MLIEDRQLINARRPELWDFLMDIPKVAECMPGVADIRLSSPDEYEVTMKVKVGAIDLKFEAKLRVLGRDRENWTATMEVAGAERGVGGAVEIHAHLFRGRGEGVADDRQRDRVHVTWPPG